MGFPLDVLVSFGVAIIFYFFQLSGRCLSRIGLPRQNDHHALGIELSTTVISIYFILLIAKPTYPEIIPWLAKGSYLEKYDWAIIAGALLILITIWVFSVIIINKLLRIGPHNLRGVRLRTLTSNVLGIIALGLCILITVGG